MLKPSTSKITLLNLIGKQNKQDVYSPSTIAGWRLKEVDSTSQVTQVLAYVSYSNIYLFEKYVAWEKPLVSALAYKKMSKEEKKQHCTLETSHSYIVIGEITGDEVNLEEVKQNYDVYKISQVEPHTMGSIAVRHYKVTLK